MKKSNLGNLLTAACVLAAVAIVGYKAVAGGADEGRSAVKVGQAAPAFQVKAVDGKAINFPEDYKGKVVLLDFWATWCPPCRAEIPNVAATYAKYHDQGFEIVSVSLDRANSGETLTKFVSEHQMTWPQIYDASGKSAVAKQYGVRAIPCPVLVDGDTGKIIATEDGALGENLTKTLETALAGKAKK